MLEITESLVLDPRTKPVVAEPARSSAFISRSTISAPATRRSAASSASRSTSLKLDRTLISSFERGSGVAVVRAAVELGQALGMR